MELLATIGIVAIVVTVITIIYLIAALIDSIKHTQEQVKNIEKVLIHNVCEELSELHEKNFPEQYTNEEEKK